MRCRISCNHRASTDWLVGDRRGRARQLTREGAGRRQKSKQRDKQEEQGREEGRASFHGGGLPRDFNVELLSFYPGNALFTMFQTGKMPVGEASM